jgi:8-oxo-dGTP pyrophosphatase MutT (NUDIX family)
MKRPAEAVIGVLWDRPLAPATLASGAASTEPRFLAIRRAPGRPFAGRWTPISGKIEQGESSREAMIREFHEEVGIKIQPLHYLGAFQIHEPEFLLHWWTVGLSEPGSMTVLLDVREADCFEWLTINQLQARPHFKEHPDFLRLSLKVE